MPHVHELYDFTSSAYIVHKDKVLLIHHKKLNVWLAPGGHIELDEDPEQTLWREVTEETGLQKHQLRLVEATNPKPEVSTAFKPLPLPFAMFVVDYDANLPHKHIDLCYLMLSSSDEVVLEERAAHEIDWFSLEKLQSLHDSGMMYDNSYEYSVFALEQLAKK